MGADFVVNSVKIFNRLELPERLSWAKVSLIDSAGMVLETSADIGRTYGRTEINIYFGLSETANSVVAWKMSPSPTGEPLLTDECKTRLKAQFQMTKDLFDSSIALIFGNKTTIGQVCSFAKGLMTNTLTKLPGFCCLDAPYQSKLDEWGEKVSSWDATRYHTVTFQQN